MSGGLRQIIALVATLAACCAAPAAGSARPPGTRNADQIASRRIAAMSLRDPHVGCRAQNAGKRASVRRWRCNWRAVAGHGAGALTCRGSLLVDRGPRGWRVRTARPAACGTATSHGAPGSGAGAPSPGAVPPTLADSAMPASSQGGRGATLQFGYNDNAVGVGELTPEQDAKLASEAGANVERVTFDWRWAEPNPGQYQFQTYDQIYSAMLARGIRPLFVLLFAPSWAWDSTVSCNMSTQDCQYPPAAAHFADAARMAALIATRYPKIAGIEVWNEPNLSHFWKPAADPVAYTQLLQTTYQAVKAANPAMPVVLGGLNNLQNNTAVDSDMSDFLGAVYALGGRSYMDAIAFHPYPVGADLTLATKSINEVVTVRHAFGDDARPLWATETGITTSDPALPVSESQQADGDVALYNALKSTAGMRMIVINTLLDWGSDPYDPEFGYGVVNRNYTPKPAFCALASLRGAFACLSMSQALL